MPKTKEEKIQEEKLLTFIVNAIYDLNKKMVIKTASDGYETKIPSGLIGVFGPDSEMLARVQSIKIGGISIKRVVKPGKNNSCEFVVRTQRREAIFTNNDTDFKRIWYAALGRYVAERNDKKHFNKVMTDVMNVIYKILRYNDNLAVAVDGGKTPKITKPKYKAVAMAGDIPQKSTKTKYEEAIKQLKAMGIQPKRFAAYIEKQTTKNK